MPRLVLALIGLILACTGRPLAQDDEAGTTTSPGGTDESAHEESGELTSTSESTDSGSSSSTTNDCLFIPCTDMPPPTDMCDVFEQDCPEGEKCVPYASSGGVWDANKCVPVLGDQAPSEPCTWAGSVEATDDCDASSICWNIQLVDEQYVGTCVAQCTGSADMPQCPPKSNCYVGQEAVIAICIPTCDPLVQDCGEGLGCYFANTNFECIFVAGDIPLGEPCNYINDCAPGNLCADAAALPSCAGSACCTAYCDLLQGDAGCLAQPGTACVPFWDVDPPAGYEHVGVCVIPP